MRAKRPEEQWHPRRHTCSAVYQWLSKHAQQANPRCHVEGCCDGFLSRATLYHPGTLCSHGASITFPLKKLYAAASHEAASIFTALSGGVGAGPQTWVECTGAHPPGSSISCRFRHVGGMAFVLWTWIRVIRAWVLLGPCHACRCSLLSQASSPRVQLHASNSTRHSTQTQPHPSTGPGSAH